MKTDLKQLLQTVCNATETLTADRAALDAAAQQPSTLRQQQLLGHTISGLRGIEGNLRGLIGETPKPVSRTVSAAPEIKK